MDEFIPFYLIIKNNMSIIILSVLLICWVIWYFLFKNKSNMDISNKWGNNGWLSNRESDWNLHVLSSINDKVVWDSMWCWTFQLVWNDMINEVVKKDVVFDPQLEIVKNLNKQTFTNKELSPNSYYSKFWLFTLDLKSEIENWIKEKFNETSDILNQLNWSNAPQSDDYYDWKNEKEYLFYTMLKKIFEFKYIFDELDKWKFADKYEDIKYFWIEWYSDSSLYDQVYVYYYNSEEDFAIALKTKEWDDVILSRWIKWNSFKDLYDNILNNKKKYEWNCNFTESDYLRVPELKFENLTEYYELEDKYFNTKNGDKCKISKAIQTIELNLDKKWWKIKSEALIRMEIEGAMPDDLQIKPIEHRYFYFDQPYVIMLKESDKDLPYFAAQISDITLFQN